MKKNNVEDVALKDANGDGVARRVMPVPASGLATPCGGVAEW